MKDHSCKQEAVLEIIVDDLKEVKRDVKSLLQYKWQVMGGAAVIGCILGVLIQVILR